tara:strand:+ start:700 stop:900 length:201 start_codon:yes stop_codon:yes gene_type:complete
MPIQWDSNGPTFLNRLRSLFKLKRRWVIEKTKVRGQEPSKVETLKFLDGLIKSLNEMREEILKSRS